MTDNKEDKQNAEKIETEKEEELEKEVSEEKPKARFTFKCTRVDTCCSGRGPIPITLWDLELWAKNGVVANFMPYLEIYQKPNGSIDLILKPLPPLPKEGEEKDAKDAKDAKDVKDPFKTVPIEELLNVKCPLYNKDDKKCLIYDNRPLSCRTYPLEYDGKNFIVVDADCPGIGEEGMTKDDLKEMRETARLMHYELTRIRIALPVLNQMISQKVMMDLMRQNMEAMSKMTDEDREKLDGIFKKNQENQENQA